MPLLRKLTSFNPIDVPVLNNILEELQDEIEHAGTPGPPGPAGAAGAAGPAGPSGASDPTATMLQNYISNRHLGDNRGVLSLPSSLTDDFRNWNYVDIAGSQNIVASAEASRLGIIVPTPNSTVASLLHADYGFGYTSLFDETGKVWTHYPDNNSFDIYSGPYGKMNIRTNPMSPVLAPQTQGTPVAYIGHDFNVGGAGDVTTALWRLKQVYDYRMKLLSPINSQQVKYGSSSLYFDNYSAWSTADSTSWDYGTGDFCIEGWYYFNDLPTDHNYNPYRYILHQPAGTQNSMIFAIYHNDNLYNPHTAVYLFFQVGHSNVYELARPYDFQINTWYHIAVARSAGVSRCFVNGVQVGTDYVNSADLTLQGTPGNLYFGNSQDGANTGGQAVYGGYQNALGFYGYINEFKISKGAARYTAPFTPAHIIGNTTSDITLISDTITAEYSPDNGRILIVLEESDAVTPNTDLFAYISRDGGAHFATVTLSRLGKIDSLTSAFYGVASLVTQNAGTSMQYMLVSDNDKYFRIKGVVLGWYN